MQSSYQRGYDAARAELSRALQEHNSKLAARLSELAKPRVLDALGQPLGPPPLDDYERGVLNGAVTANRTILMFLGHTSQVVDGEVKPLGLQPGD